MKRLFTFLLLIILTASTYASGLRGYVRDAATREPLRYATVAVEGSIVGTRTDDNGYYDLSYYELSVAGTGPYKLVARYLGYADGILELDIKQGETKTHNFELSVMATTMEVVEITAQASGQWQAVNQQLTSRTITNVVSRAQIQELPESNAAEAVGRLPGVSLERTGGEGNKVVIRGMSSKYTQVQIDGVAMAATGSGDRSVDLSMISPYMLEGIELTKAVMANQEATATGGIVNFKLKRAPDNPSLNVIVQGGHNSLRNTYQDYKASVGGSNRFFSKRLGVYGQVDFEEKDASAQQLGNVDIRYEDIGDEVVYRTRGMRLMDVFRHNQRLGGTFVMDLNLPNTTITSTNFFSRINREETRFQNSYNFHENNFSLDYTDTPESITNVVTNSLQIEHRWRRLKVNSAFSHSFSENTLPARINGGISGNTSKPYPQPGPGDARWNVDVDPMDLPGLLYAHMPEFTMRDAVNEMNLGGMGHEQSQTKERDIAGELNFSYTINVSGIMKIDLHAGAKYKRKTKEYDRTVVGAGFTGGAQEARNLVYDYFQDGFSDRTKERWAQDNMHIPLSEFLDKDYDGTRFLKEMYDFGFIFDKQKYRSLHNLLMDTYDPASMDMYDIVTQNFPESNYNDYHGTEDYNAFYLMPEIQIGKLTFVPGVRYEAERTEYTGYRGSRLGVLRDFTRTPIDTVTKVRENEFFLPMINLFYNPLEWLTIKAGYTHTLQRPNYDNIMPGWLIGTQGSISNLSNFRLRPEQSRNLDLQVSVFSNKIGLLSAGVFHKKISDMIFWTGNTIARDTAYFELPTLMHNQRIAYAKNNENDAFNYGFEVEWQSNFWYLPGILKGLVMNVNFTRNRSEAQYPISFIKTVVDPVTYRATLVSNDTTYTNPMIHQPAYLVNFTLGYDIKGFSIRTALNYRAKVFTQNSFRSGTAALSDDFYRVDISIRQKLPVKGMECFFNINNLLDQMERSSFQHYGFARSIESYGRNANAGLRYMF
jgi:TonB-dependent receptor